MNEQLVEKIKANPNYQQLVKKRTSFAIKLGIFVLAMFYAYILTIAFNPSLLGTKTGDGVMTIGYPIGIAIIVISFLTTLIYVRRANGEYEELIEKVREDVKDEL
ncbi:DUF485 domain-containing protein [Halarcobacter sp.]|uniref:DUF485 domain-containing protein n=1 Tax=Halarcobacter sp. TaxID=2321133 RepID=UPI0029F4B9E3|nr:DUF485 domain-containing protein [Halarcobacter sp.]